MIIGPDLIVRDGKVLTDAGKRSSQDQSIRGYKSMLREDAKSAKALGDRIIKNTYRTLMSRGQKGCFVFCVDKETNEYFRQFIEYQSDDSPVAAKWPEAAEPDSAGIH